MLAALGVVERFAGSCGKAAGGPEGLEAARKLLAKLHVVPGLPQVRSASCVIYVSYMAGQGSNRAMMEGCCMSCFFLHIEWKCLVLKAGPA